MMRAATTTAPRIGIGYGYCEQTLREMVEKDPTFQATNMGVFVDHHIVPSVPEGTYVHVTPPIELADATHGGIRLTLNLVRALKWIAETGEPGCVFEDDVILARDWYKRVEALVRVVSGKCDKWMITLHHLYRLEDFDRVDATGFGEDLLMKWKYPTAFYANHGLCMPAAVASQFAMTISEKMLLPVYGGALDWYADMGINRACALHKIPIFNAHPCMCKHIGEVSAYGHRAPPASPYFKG